MVILRDLKDFRISNLHVTKDIPLSLGALKGPADDGNRSEAERTLYTAGIEERGVPEGEGTATLPDGRPADR